MTKEVWKRIPFHLLVVAGPPKFPYEVSSFGRLRLGQNGPLMSQSKSLRHYHWVRFSFEGKNKVLLPVHSVVASAFLRRRRRSHIVNHKNYVPGDNHVCNLEWVSRSEDKKHAQNSPFTQSDRSRSLVSVRKAIAQELGIRYSSIFYEDGRPKEIS